MDTVEGYLHADGADLGSVMRACKSGGLGWRRNFDGFLRHDLVVLSLGGSCCRECRILHVCSHITNRVLAVLILAR